MPADPPLDVRRAIGAVRRNGRLIAAFVGVAMLLAIVISVAAPVRYQATARIADDPTPATAVDPATSDRRLATSQALVTSPAVLAGAATRLRGETADSLAGKVTANVNQAAGILDVVATDSDPARTSQIATVVAETFLADRRRAEQIVISQARQRLTAEITALGTAAAAQPTADAMRQQLSQLSVDQALAGTELRLAEPAAVPATRQAPRPLRAAILAGLAAAIIAVLIALARDLGRTTPDAETLSRLTEAPLLAALPDPPSRLERLLAITERRRRHLEERASIEVAVLEGAIRQALGSRRRRVLVVHGVGPQNGARHLAGALARRLGDQGYAIVESPMDTEALQELASSATAVLLVARLGHATSPHARNARRLFGALGLHELGLVVTGPARELPTAASAGFAPPAPPPTRSRRTSTNGTGPAHAVPTHADHADR